MPHQLVKVGATIASKSKTRNYLRPPPPRPIAGIPRSSEFNSTVRMDYFFFEGKCILHFADSFSRFCAGGVLGNRSAESTATCLLEEWLSVHGPMSVLIGDLGGEFTGNTLRSVCDHFGVDLRAVPVAAHWAHDVMEIRHHVVARMMERLRLEFSGASVASLFHFRCWPTTVCIQTKVFLPFSSCEVATPPFPLCMTSLLSHPSPVLRRRPLRSYIVLGNCFSARRPAKS